MRMLIVVPPHTKPFWLKVVAHNLSSKHPDVVVVSPVDRYLHGYLNRYKVSILEPPIPEPRPIKWLARIKWWWDNQSVPELDPWGTCDVVLVLWDQSHYAMEGVRKAHLRGKKTWFVRMV